MDDTSHDRSSSPSLTDDRRMSRSFIKNGIGGAGNYRTLPPTQPCAPDLPRSFTSTYGTSNSSFSSGRGGSGNMHPSYEKARRVLDMPSTPPSSFSSASSSSDIAPKRNRTHSSEARTILPNVVSTAPKYVSTYRHCGIGGAGNVKSKPSQTTGPRFASRNSGSSSDTPTPYYARNPPPPISGADQITAKLKNAFGGLRRERKSKGKDGCVVDLPNEMVVMQGPYDLGRAAERPQG
ncbi:MAG: hypothetical protein M1812_004168 [Candelaria pacifica]|nr:MAG: hypothetical protein M1812_004168 [Candelaria pacifica]